MTIGEWIDRFGEERVKDLARRLGGQRMYIPSKGRLHPEIHAVLGERAEELRWSHAGLRIHIPNYWSVRKEFTRREVLDAARKMISNGLPDSAVQRATGLNTRTVAKLRSAAE